MQPQCADATAAPSAGNPCDNPVSLIEFVALLQGACTPGSDEVVEQAAIHGVHTREHHGARSRRMPAAARNSVG